MRFMSGSLFLEAANGSLQRLAFLLHALDRRRHLDGRDREVLLQGSERIAPEVKTLQGAIAAQELHA
jgi:hypothetical protein